ncbi:MAG: hypothetical protein IJ216_04180 [Acidaminococcaceae bacterium]|nr:hypothetical protein [Acidaminococcaceae bacterium]
MKIMIATGASRTAKRWKNQEILWDKFLDKLRTTTRTRETMAEYLKLPKRDQDRVKDVGGFVGGYLKNGRRLAGNVVHRQLVTLDADFGDDSLLSTLDLFYSDTTYAVYSTHKHTKDHPRLRIVFPLAKPVGPDAYQAIARRLASDIGMDLFDDTTYEPERLMYWPSTAADGEYVFTENEGVFLDPDKVLSLYDDWHDASTWPVSSRQNDIILRTAKKQGDPLAKPGLVGAFCRSYTIREAIEAFLPEAYAETGKPDRFTYTKGSTTAGLVLYEDGKFAFSHHGTDPVSGKLVNAFDLVRIHKFREQDEEVRSDTAVNNLPSYKAMCELAAADGAVREELDRERIEMVRNAFDDGFVDTDFDAAWMKELDRDKKGNIESTPQNIKLILEKDPNLAGRVAYNDFSFRTVLLQNLPWRSKSQGGVWKDADDSCLRNYLSTVYGIKGANLIGDACAEVFMQKHFHPVRDYIKSQKWDGEKRAETLWIDYLGAKDTEYVRTVTRKHLVAAVARVFRPGCKFDNVIILTGPQGIGKSTMLKKLGREWFSDSLTTVQGKEAYEQLHGVWIAELGELYATKKSESEAVKQFLSKTEDNFRVAYGHHTAVFPRQCVFYGTTNDTLFLRDRTGNRRFWPVEVTGKGTKPFTDFTDDVVGQVWAEAYQLYQDGESLFLDPDMEKEARNMQEAHSEVSEKLGLIQEYLDTKLPWQWKSMGLPERRAFLKGDDDILAPNMVGEKVRDRVCVLEIWCEVFGGDPKNLTNLTSREINTLMDLIPGWERSKNAQDCGKLYGRQRIFIREQTHVL